jgi:hypothetical protein
MSTVACAVGDRVEYRCPKGWGSGTIVNVVEGKCTIETRHGRRVVRTAVNVRRVSAAATSQATPSATR